MTSRALSLAVILLLVGCDAGPAVLTVSAGDGMVGFAASELEHVKLIEERATGVRAIRICLYGDAHDRLETFSRQHIGEKLKVSVGGTLISQPMLREPIHVPCAHFSLPDGTDAAKLVAVLTGSN